MRRRAVLAALAAAGPALAQDRTVRFVVPFPPGGPVDTAARLLAAAMAGPLGQPILVENRGGAGGTIGVDAVAKAAPDGLTLAFASTGPASVAMSLIPGLPYDTLRDFAPVTIVGATPSLLVVRAASPVRSLAELVALAKRRPGLTFGSTGPGGTPHLAPELLALRAGIQLTHVAYRGAAPAITALLAGELELSFHDLAVLLPHVREGTLRALAVASPVRSAVLPEVPTMAEAGVPGVETETWYPLLAPAATPPARVAALHAAVVAALGDAELRRRFAAMGTRAIGNTPDQARGFIAAEIAKWGEVVRVANIRAD